MQQRMENGRGDHDCRCGCAGCKSGNHCHNLAAGCKAQYW